MPQLSVDENDLKWALIQPRPGEDGYDFAPAEAFVEFGLKNDMYIVGHTLVWHGQTPGWVFQAAGSQAQPPAETSAAGVNAPAGGRPGRGVTGPLATREELLERMRDHIHTVVGRYRGNAMGTQTHINVSTTYETIDETLGDLASIGLPVHMTELDVNTAVRGQANTGADISGEARPTRWWRGERTGPAAGRCIRGSLPGHHEAQGRGEDRDVLGRQRRGFMAGTGSSSAVRRQQSAQAGVRRR